MRGAEAGIHWQSCHAFPQSRHVEKSPAQIIPFPARHDPILSKRQAAAYLGVSTRTIERRIADGSLRWLRLGQLVKLRLSDLDRLLKEGQS